MYGATHLFASFGEINCKKDIETSCGQNVDVGKKMSQDWLEYTFPSKFDQLKRTEAKENPGQEEEEEEGKAMAMAKKVLEAPLAIQGISFASTV